MPIHYHVDIARFVCDADAKWIDNLLSRFDVPGIEAARQGIARRVSEDGVHHIVLTWRLFRDLNVPVGDALALSTALLSAERPSVTVSPGLDLHFDRASFLREINQSIGDAVESIVPARRGRPPRV